MMRELLALLVEGFFASSLAVLLVLLVRRSWARWFGAAQLRGLWLLVPAALLAVALPAPVQTAMLGSAEPVAFAARETAALAVGGAAGYDRLYALALGVWLLGCLLSLGRFWRLQRTYIRGLGRTQARGERICIAESAGIGPAVLGLLRPRIVLPADFEQRFDAEQQALVLTHERSHLRGGDIIANAIATALRTLYWFNPLIHHAAACMRHDHELASDADVLRRHPHARRRYADTLLNAQLAVPGLPVGCLWQSSHPLKERLIMLKQAPHPRHRVILGLATGILLTLGVSALAWSMQPARQSAAEEADAPSPPAAAAIGADSDPTYRALKPPRYPKEALEASQSGRLLLDVEVDAEGRPLRVSVASSTNPGVFDASAIEAVKGWRFNPAMKDGKPSASRVQVPVCFSLSDESACPGPDAALDGIYIRPPAA